MKPVKKKRFEILNFLPPYGDIYVPIAEDNIQFFSEGYVVRFERNNEKSWVANFKTGWTSFSKIYDFPELRKTIVFACGECYLMEDENQKPLKSFGGDYSEGFVTDDNVIIAAGGTSFTVIELNKNLVWDSDQISFDGLKDLKLKGDLITGLAYTPTSGEGNWDNFTFNFRTKKVTGGAFHSSEWRKWWKFWQSN
jgi:hypothetical protein